MKPPLEVMVLTTEEVLFDIYDEEELAQTSTDDASKAFVRWIEEHNAHFVASDTPEHPDFIVKAVLETIRAGKNIVVVSSRP